MIKYPKPIVVDVPELPNGWYLLSFKVLRKNRLALVSTNVDVIAALKRSRENTESSKPEKYLDNAVAKIWVFDGESIYEGPEFKLLDPFPIVDQFADGRWLVSYSRSDGKAHSRILDLNGVETNRLELGDGIEHIKIDESHRIWVGWFDEGVYGNDNWQFPGQKWPPSSNGLAAFDVEGKLVRSFTDHIIDDCYAMNVFGEEAWACTYSDFPILRMNNTDQNLWKSNLSGIKAIAVDYPYVIAAGGYRDDFNLLHLLRLEKESTSILKSWRIPELKSRPTYLQELDGRADALHVVCDNRWYKWNVLQFVDQLSD